MITEIKTEFISKDSTSFIQDDDKKLYWLSKFDSKCYDKFIVFIDKNVKIIWGDKILLQLNKHKKNIIIMDIEAIEDSKSINFYPKIIEFLELNRCSRYDLVFAIGGGIILDLISFVASTYMRGIPFLMIPTTLIGQTDASTGGKTCLNSKNSKNLMGTFYYPKTVYNNINFLYTNSNRYLRQGFSEAFKYGLLNSKELIDNIIQYKQSSNSETLKNIIDLTIKSRISIRQRDALASNLGHTFGHAMEKFSDYKMLHGDAISAGTVIALHYAVYIGIMNEQIKNKIIVLMKELGLNLFIDIELTSNKLIELMLLDKKSSSSVLNLVLIKNISEPYEEEGRLFCKSLPQNIKVFLDNFLDNYKYRQDKCCVLLEQDNLNYED